MEAGRFIKDLLYQADLVRIPGLGTFISTYQNATTDIAGKKISPPAKKFEFDDSRKDDDDLMWTWISEQEGISETEAKNMVADFVADVNHEIHEGREISIEGLGTFFGDVTGRMEFHFSVENNFNAESIGFKELDLPGSIQQDVSIHTEPAIEHQGITIVPAKEPEFKIPIAKPKPTPPVVIGPVYAKKSRKGIWIAVFTVIIIAVLAFFGYQQRSRIGDLTHSWFAKGKAVVTDTLTRKQKADTGIDKTLAEQAKMQKALDVKSIDSSKTFIPYGTRLMKYYIVAASFTKYENALKLKDELRGKGFDSEIVTVTHKYYKVTMGAYKEKQQAQVELEKLKTITQNNNLWLLHI